MQENRLQHPFKVIISGGGTGGHVFPAIAIANALKAINPQIEILFVGAEGKMEMEKVPQAGYRIEGLPVQGFQRSFSLSNLTTVFKLIKSLTQAKNIINSFHPDVVVGVGGYASGPVLYMAQNKHIPTLIQEQNSYAGLTNKLLARKTSKICVAYDRMERFFPKEKIVYTGNPVRQDIIDHTTTRQDAFKSFGLNEDKKTLLVVGGSLGARTINESLILGINELIENDIQVIWQTGKVYYNQIKSTVNEHPLIKIMPFITDMSLAYEAADVIISRAGALAISELCIVGKPVILVPSPNVAEDHQTQNALSLSMKSAAIMISDSEAKQGLVHNAVGLLKDIKTQQGLSENIKKLATPDAARLIAEEIIKLAHTI